MPDKYTYPNTEVLKNKFHVKDSILLHAYERKYVTIRQVELSESPIKGNFDLKHLQKIHEHLFQDIYTWAGKIREIDIGKVDQLNQELYEFCPSHTIEGYAEDIFGAIKKDNYLKNLDKDEFAKKAARGLGELNKLHPFREGNGRTQREFMRELAANAGWKLSFENISREQMIEASITSMNMNYELMEDLIKCSISPLGIEQTPEYLNRIKEIENVPEVRKARVTSAKILYDSYAKEALIRNHGVWKPELDKEIALHMKEDGISDLKIVASLTNSPDFLGYLSIDKHIKSRMILRDIAQKHPELKSLDLSR